MPKGVLAPGLAAFNEKRKAEREAKEAGPIAQAALSIRQRAEERRRLILGGKQV